MPRDTKRFCCDGLCQQGRRCASISPAIFAPTYDRATDMPRSSWLRRLVRWVRRML